MRRPLKRSTSAYLRLFTDTEPREQCVQDVLHAHFAGDAAECAQSEPKVLCSQLRQIGDLRRREPFRRLLQRGAVTRLGQRRRP